MPPINKNEIEENARKLLSSGIDPIRVKSYIDVALKELPQDSLPTDIDSGFSFGKNVAIAKEAIPALAKKLITGAIPSKSELPEFVGTMASMNPLVSSVGAAGGEAYKQLGQRVGAFEGKPPETSAEAARLIGGAAVRGLGAGVVGKTVGKARDVLFKKVPTAISDALIGTTAIESAPAIAKNADTLGAKMLGKPEMEGSRKQILNKIKLSIGDVESKVQNTINNLGAKKDQKIIDTFEIAQTLDPLIQKSKDVLDPRAARQLIKIQNDFLERYGEKISPIEANKIKRDLYSVISDKAYIKSLSDNPAKVQGQRALASALREKLTNLIPNLSKLNTEQGVLIMSRDDIIKTIAKQTGSVMQALTGDLTETALSTGSKYLNKFKPQDVLPGGSISKAFTQRVLAAASRRLGEQQ